MDLKKDYGVSKKLENEGSWIEIDDETEVLIARANNKNFINLMETLSRPHKRILNNKKTTKAMREKRNEIAEDILCEVYAKTIVLDWKGMKEGEENIEYSHDECYRILKEYPDFRDIISEEAQNMANFIDEELEDLKENLD